MPAKSFLTQLDNKLKVFERMGDMIMLSVYREPSVYDSYAEV